MKFHRVLNFTVLFLVCGFLLAFSPEDLYEPDKPIPSHMKKGFTSIKSIDSFSYLEFIAADELEGRDTATRGLTIARKYIQSLYKTWGVEPAGDWSGEAETKKRSFEQRMDMVEVKFGEGTSLEIRSGTRRALFEWGEDFSGGSGASIPGAIESPAVFTGYGISAPDLGYDDFEGIDVRDKIVITRVGKPGGDRPDSPFNHPDNRARFAGRYTPAEKCARLLARKGALALLIIDENFGRVNNAGGYIQGARIRSSRRPVVAPSLSASDPMVPFFWASPSIAESLFSGSGIRFAEAVKQIDETLKPRSQFFADSHVRIHLDITRKQTVSANLLGMIQGSDPVLKKEFVIIGAHLDHVGMNDQGYVFNGADDNGSGSVGVLQAAKAFALNPVKPKRSILFAHWTGEEKGLLGSRHYVAFPSVPLSDIVACINLDMICRDTVLSSILEDVSDLGFDKDQLSRYPDDPQRLVAAFVSKPSPALGDSSVRIGKDYCGLVIVPLPSYPMLGNSDHFPFSQKGVPSVFFNTEGHRDLHQPGDTVEKINAKKMSQIVKLSYLLAFSIADAQGKPVWKNR
jgi:hypothetical protein